MGNGWMIIAAGLAVGIVYYAYEWYRQREEYSEQPYGGPGGARFSEDEYIVLEQTEAKRRGYRERSLPDIGTACAICQERLREENEGYSIVCLPECNHWFHHRCALRLLEYFRACPICRLPIDESSLRSARVVVSNSSVDAGSVASNSSLKRRQV